MEKANNTDFIIFDVGEIQYAMPMEYTAFIVMATEQFPLCVPPKMPSCIKCVMQMELGLVPIVDLTLVPGYSTSNRRIISHPLILVVSYRGEQVGLLTDRVVIQPAEAEVAEGTIARPCLVNSNGTNFVQFDVEKFYNQLGAVQA